MLWCSFPARESLFHNTSFSLSSNEVFPVAQLKAKHGMNQTYYLCGAARHSLSKVLSARNPQPFKVLSLSVLVVLVGRVPVSLFSCSTLLSIPFDEMFNGGIAQTVRTMEDIVKNIYAPNSCCLHAFIPPLTTPVKVFFPSLFRSTIPPTTLSHHVRAARFCGSGPDDRRYQCPRRGRRYIS